MTLTQKSVIEILEDVSYFNVAWQDWHWVVKQTDTDFYLQLRFVDMDGNLQSCRKHRLSVWMKKSEVVRTAFTAILAAEEHEARRKFLYRGRPIFGPHSDVDALWAVCCIQDKRDPHA